MGRFIESARQAHQDLPEEKFDEMVEEAAKNGDALSRQDVKRAANKYKPKSTHPRPEAPIDMTPAPASLNVEESLRKRVVGADKGREQEPPGRARRPQVLAGL